jgi:hypothetical protein
MAKLFKQGTISITGSTRTGKTYLVYKILQNLELLFTPPAPKQVLYCYGVYQELFEDMKAVYNTITFHKGMPQEETLSEFINPSDHKLIILDDLNHLLTIRT